MIQLPRITGESGVPHEFSKINYKENELIDIYAGTINSIPIINFYAKFFDVNKRFREPSYKGKIIAKGFTKDAEMLAKRYCIELEVQKSPSW